MAFMRYPFYVIIQDGYVTINGSDDEGSIHGRIESENFDKLVMMRYHQLSEEEKDRLTHIVLDEQYESGADSIRNCYGMPTVMERVRANVAGYGL